MKIGTIISAPDLFGTKGWKGAKLDKLPSLDLPETKLDVLRDVWLQDIAVFIANNVSFYTVHDPIVTINVKISLKKKQYKIDVLKGL